MKYSVLTFGCRVNQADSLAFEEQFLEAGAVSVSPDSADVVVVNTCSVTASADQGARQAIRRVARLNPNARIVVTGCYATREPAGVATLPGVASIVPNDDKPNVVWLAGGAGLRPVGDAPSTAGRFGDGDGACGAAIEPGVAGRTAFTLRVQTGCAEPCSYCIIPSTRGAPRSLPLASVLADVERVRRSGFREVVLTGVHLGSYGRDLSPRLGLIDLLRGIDAVARRGGLPGQPADVVFRISSLEPMDCTTDLIDLVASSGTFAPHFHLPMQHASDRMLAAMRRPYTRDQYGCLVNTIRTRIPQASIGSDVIVGFPGETDDDFEALARFLESSPLTHLHVFPYSDRPGTVASALGNRAPGTVVRERGARLRAIGAALSRAFVASQVGTVHRALTLEDGSLAVTGNYLKVRVPPGQSRNQWVDVRVLVAVPVLVGEVVQS